MCIDIITTIRSLNFYNYRMTAKIIFRIRCVICESFIFLINHQQFILFMKMRKTTNKKIAPIRGRCTCMDRTYCKREHIC